MNHRLIFSLSACLLWHFAGAQNSGLHVTKTFKIGSPGGWDYISVGPDQKIYVSHGTQVNILDAKTGDPITRITFVTAPHNTIVSLDGSRAFLEGQEKGSQPASLNHKVGAADQHRSQ